MLLAYCGATSCAQGETLQFHISGSTDGTVAIEDATGDRLMLQGNVSGPLWELKIPLDWPSSLYRAKFRPGDLDVYFVVRALKPAARILVSIPFATWLAYDRSGVPGEGLYYAEEPGRAYRVTFDRPWCGPPPERWEDGLLRWLAPAGYKVDYCSNVDLHSPVGDYQLLVINGHDEYWSWEMRDNVESFARNGGNLAFLGGNTSYWQARFEDNLRTMVCYRDAVADPVADRSRTTVEWSSPVVNRPENSMTGVSYRRGAGSWGPFMGMMKEHAYTARFADHWVFDGTGVADGMSFGLGAIGYETDAAAFTEIDGVPKITGADGTPPSFVILATADLRHWRTYGQGGFATMGVFQLGAGTVFNAATVNWGNTLTDPVVDRVTRNVLDRLSHRQSSQWEPIGSGVDALTACEHRYFGILDGALVTREAGGQNLRWQPIADDGDAICLASPSEAVASHAVGLYAVTSLGVLRFRPGTVDPAPWVDLGTVPQGTVDLAICDGTFFAVANDSLWAQPMADIPPPAHIVLPAFAASPVLTDPPPSLSDDAALAEGDSGSGWVRVDAAEEAVAMTALGGRLYLLDRRGNISTRLAFRTPSPWEFLLTAEGFAAISAHNGRLLATARDRHLCWRS